MTTNGYHQGGYFETYFVHIIVFRWTENGDIFFAYLERDDQESNEMTKEKLNCFPHDKFNPHYAAHSGDRSEDDDD